MLIDFSEIPPAKHPSIDTEAFEKFAKQFFEVLFDGKIEKTAGRGADGGIDLIVEVGSERWMVSCKHYLNTSVVSSDELDPAGRIRKCGCQRFVGFYSGSPNNSLIDTLTGLARYDPDFKYTIWNNRDIEAKLFSLQSANGWILAARWFPKSYSKVFSQLVHPLDHYTVDDIQIHEDEGKLRAGNVPIAVHFSKGDKASQKLARFHALTIANEDATCIAFDRIFLNRIAELACLFPGTFAKLKFRSDNDLKCWEIFPSWDFKVLCQLILNSKCTARGIVTICRVWSFWDAELAVEHLRASRMIVKLLNNGETFPPMSLDETHAFFKAKLGITDKELSDYQLNFCQKQMNISEIGASARTLERGYFAGLLCFYPTELYRAPDRDSSAVFLSRHFGEEEELRSRLHYITDGLPKFDKDYVMSHSSETLELLKSIRMVDDQTSKFGCYVERNLRCFNENMLEEWIPIAEISTDLRMIFS